MKPILILFEAYGSELSNEITARLHETSSTEFKIELANDVDKIPLPIGDYGLIIVVLSSDSATAHEELEKFYHCLNIYILDSMKPIPSFVIFHESISTPVKGMGITMISNMLNGLTDVSRLLKKAGLASFSFILNILFSVIICDERHTPYPFVIITKTRI